MPSNYRVKVYAVKTDEVHRIMVPLSEACAPNTTQPSRFMAGLRARQLCAERLDAEYSPEHFKVLAIEEIK